MWQNYSRGQGFLGLKAALLTVAMRCSQAQCPVSWRLEQEEESAGMCEPEKEVSGETKEGRGLGRRDTQRDRDRGREEKRKGGEERGQERGVGGRDRERRRRRELEREGE